MILKNPYAILAVSVAIPIIVFLIQILIEPKDVIYSRAIFMSSIMVTVYLAFHMSYYKNKKVSVPATLLIWVSTILFIWQGYHLIRDFIDWFLIEANLK